MKPYKETENGNIVRRTFSDNISESELVWHRDHEDRVVLPLNENDWMVQFDNELPTKLTVGEEYFIPKNTFHRVIKGSGELQVEIIKTDFDEIIEEAEKKAKRDACYHKVRARYDVWPSAYACVPENTSKALTRNGWKSVDELNVGEEIMTYNIENDELEFKPILNLHRYKDVKTNIVKSGNNGFVFEATDNHKWVVKLPETKGKRLEKYNRINDKALIETTDLLENKNNKHLVVSAQYNGGKNLKLDKIFKYGTNWVKYILDITNEQRQAWLFSAIVYDGNQQKVERLTENINNIEELDWAYTGTQGKQSFGFKQKDIEHRDAFLLSAFLNSGLVTWKKVKDKDIYSCHYTSNKKFKNTSNFKLVKENIANVWCPETENGTWIMMQETDGNGIITITGNSGALVKCRKVGAANWGNSSNEGEENLEELTVYEAKKTDFSKEKSQGLHGWFSRKGGEGSSGWVDCNTCRKDPKTGRKKCKPCGRQDGEKRKYPACRPTPSSCGTRGKGKKWGKKSTSEGLNISEKFIIFDENYLKMRILETFNHEEPLVLPAEPKTKPKESPMIQPSRRNKPFLPERETQPDPKAISENKNVKEISINIPNEHILKRVMSTPTLNRLVRTELKVGQNIERVNHKQYSDIMRLYPMLGIEITEL
jgi:hypothetical protein